MLACGSGYVPAGFPGLQNLWRVALRAAVGSTPIHSCHSWLLTDVSTVPKVLIKTCLNCENLRDVLRKIRLIDFFE